MVTNLQITIAFIAGIMAGTGITIAGLTIRNLHRRIVELEMAQAKHLPYRTAEEIEDATAALNRLMFDLDLKREFAQNALAHLQKARAGNGKE